MSENIAEEKNGNKKPFKTVLLFLIFLVVGVSIGIYGTQKVLDKKESDKEEEIPVVEGPEDITENENYKDLISNLYSIIDGNPIFYSTKGISGSSIDNNSKLIIIYNTLLKDNKFSKDALTNTILGSTTCNNTFILDPSTTPNVPTNTCTYNKFDREEFKNVSKKLFNNDILDTSVAFNPVPGTRCVVSADGKSYNCGMVTANLQGKLESKFTIDKVTKDDDGTIIIYEKGYLVDKRPGVDNPNDQYDNYYLHSSDSKDYYYELKSADNLTFKHTFKTSDRSNYYYVNTELSKE